MSQPAKLRPSALLHRRRTRSQALCSLGDLPLDLVNCPSPCAVPLRCSHPVCCSFLCNLFMVLMCLWYGAPQVVSIIAQCAPMVWQQADMPKVARPDLAPVTVPCSREVRAQHPPECERLLH